VTFSLADIARMDPHEDDSLNVWRDTVRWVIAAVVVVALQWAAIAGDGWVGLLSYVDLGVHEFGHMMLMWAPPVLHSFGGTLFQFAVPLGLAAYFGLARRDGFAAALMLGWEAVALRNIAVYIADAPVRVLPLLGGQDGHDWAFLLGRWGVLDSAETIATVVEVLGFCAALAGLAIAVWGYIRPRLHAREQAEYESRLKTLPVREPRNPVEISVHVDE